MIPISADTRVALRELIAVAAPTVATMTSYTLMQFIDGYMVSRITPHDTVHLAAQGNGGVWSWVPMSLFAGLSGVVNTYVAQNLGAGKPERGAAYAWNALWLGAILWLVVLVPLALVIPQIFALMGHEQRLVELESVYARILLLGGIVTVVSRGLAQFFYGLHRPGITLIAAIVGNTTNIVFNYGLIYGELGMPALGVEGAAWGTVIGTTVEALIPLALFLSPRYERLYHTRRAWRVSRAHMRDIVKIGWPPALMYGNEMVCWAVFMTYLAASFGTAHNTAGWIVLRYMHLSFMPAVGLSVALTAVVGKCLGAQRPDLAAQRARLGIATAMAYMGACALLFVLLREPLVRLFLAEGTDPQSAATVLAIGTQLMIVAAVFQVFDGLGISLIGILRGAGDTTWPSVVAAVLSWVCIVGLGAALAFWIVPHWGSLGPWLAAAVYIIITGIALGWRFMGGAWKRRNLLGQSEVSGVVAAVSPGAGG